MSVRGGLIGGGLGTVVLVIAALALGVDPTALLQAGGGGPAPSSEPAPLGTPDDDMGRFVDVVLGDTEATWSRVFAEGGADYPEPRLVLYDDAVRSACGTAGSAVGPFYCPRDARIYLDLSFFRQLRERFGAPGDFAQAYVIAHEVGHHVQNVTGTMEGFGGYSESGPDSRAVRMELQADCYAGIWAHDSEAAGYAEPGDLREALDAAAAIGDDNIQRQTQGTVVPESFTHGTSDQRMAWFRRGYETGDPGACDTFSGAI
jgi:predicted metalloprotease